MNKPIRVLIVEDSEDDALLIIEKLRSGGYEPAFERVETRKAMEAALDNGRWDVILADYVMPHFSGLAALKLMQKKKIGLPFIVVSGTIGEDIAVNMMKEGAHDYLMKGNLARLSVAIEREMSEAENRAKRKQAEKELEKYRNHLETLVEERTKELKDAQEQLVLKEKLVAIGQVSGSIAHELRNPLATMQSSSYYLSRVLKDADDKVKKHLTLIQDTILLSNNIITNLLSLTRARSLSPVKSDVNRIVKDVLTDFKTVEGITINTQLEENLPTVPLDIIQISSVFKNIISNSVQAIPEGGSLDIKTEMKGDFVGVEFKDTGTGISKENIQKIYEPLFITKAKGIGLGLSLVKTIIDEHNGSILVESEIGKGTTFTLKLAIK